MFWQSEHKSSEHKSGLLKVIGQFSHDDLCKVCQQSLVGSNKFQSFVSQMKAV